MEGMPPMNMTRPPSSAAMGPMPHHKMGMMMHMTFFWGKDVEILFSGWPGHSLGLYILALFVIFALAFLVESLSAVSRRLSSGSPSGLSAGLLQTALHAARVGIAYLVMLAVMSFNAGVFLVAVAGYAIGFFVFGSGVFKWAGPEPDAKRAGAYGAGHRVLSETPC